MYDVCVSANQLQSLHPLHCHHEYTIFFENKRPFQDVDKAIGERIVQLADEPPSHIVMPAIHLKAENGAIWVRESQMIHRAAPFLAQHLALVPDQRALVATLHEAYERLRIDAEGFGVFIAGPSKTADIEQALVVGAHGPRSLTVVLY